MFNVNEEWYWKECYNQKELMILLKECEDVGITWCGGDLPTDIGIDLNDLVFPVTVYFHSDNNTITYSDSYEDDDYE